MPDRVGRPILSGNAAFFVRDAVVAHPSSVGTTLTLAVPAADRVDQIYKGMADRSRASEADLEALDALKAQGRLSRPFDAALFTRSDSRLPETAGLAGAMLGSAYILLVCFAVSLPVGLAAAIHLEEFAPRNRLTALVELTIRTLSDAPPILFGLLGLTIFVHMLGLPRATPLVGGLVLGLMTLPSIILAARAALRAVPVSLREAAYGVGASRHQVVLHHVLPLAWPGILSGTIASLARALGEAAPLLLVGMSAFIADPPNGLLDAAITLPTQIYLWATDPAPGFQARAAAGSLVLLTLLIAMNALAVFLRRRARLAGAGHGTVA